MFKIIFSEVFKNADDFVDAVTENTAITNITGVRKTFRYLFRNFQKSQVRYESEEDFLDDFFNVYEEATERFFQKTDIATAYNELSLEDMQLLNDTVSNVATGSNDILSNSKQLFNHVTTQHRSFGERNKVEAYLFTLNNVPARFIQEYIRSFESLFRMILSTSRRDPEEEDFRGPPGPDGASAYEVATRNGYNGNEEQWLLSLHGRSGAPGGKGDKGDKGDQGTPGGKGDKGDQGDQGTPGGKGDKGDQGTPGGKGDKGDKGDQGTPGGKGDKGDKGDQGTPGGKGDKGDKGDPGSGSSPVVIDILEEPLHSSGEFEASLIDGNYFYEVISPPGFLTGEVIDFLRDFYGLADIEVDFSLMITTGMEHIEINKKVKLARASIGFSSWAATFEYAEQIISYPEKKINGTLYLSLAPLPNIYNREEQALSIMAAFHHAENVSYELFVNSAQVIYQQIEK